jgi:hypothetical protein
MRAELCGFPDMAAAQTAAYRGIANATSLAALPLVGVLSTTGMVSCFVEVPFNLVSTDPTPVARTVLRIGGNCEIVLSLSDVLRGSDHIGFFLTNRPLWLAGEEYQPDDADQVVALVEGVMQSTGVGLIGPIRCRRCNHAVPSERAHILGSNNCLCIRCQTTEENWQ